MRDLIGPTQGRAIRDLLQSLLAAEVLSPSVPLWILSGWISDIPLIDNRTGQFAASDISWPQTLVPFSTVLRTIVARGGSLAIVLRDVDHNTSFLARMRELRGVFPGQVRVVATTDFHAKGIVGKDFDLSGSMNLTHRGIEVNDEHLIYRVDPATVAERRITLESLWGSLLNAST
jgi:hypothetical protein